MRPRMAAPAARTMMELSRRLAAECIGTGLLVAAVVGSGIMASGLTADGAVALLANALATGAVLVVLITLFAPVSGAHFNPAVSLVFALRRELTPAQAALYVPAQTIGAIAGTFLAHAMFALPLIELSQKVRSGPPQWLAEAVATFGLVAVILGGIKARRTALPWLVGLYITAAYWFTASTAFANPAVTIGRVLTDTFSGIRPADAPAFIVAQIAGALAALPLAGWLWAETAASQETAAPQSGIIAGE